MKTIRENLTLSKTRIWNMNAIHLIASKSKARPSCHEQTCLARTCEYTCKHSCDDCEKN